MYYKLTLCTIVLVPTVGNSRIIETTTGRLTASLLGQMQISFVPSLDTIPQRHLQETSSKLKFNYARMLFLRITNYFLCKFCSCQYNLTSDVFNGVNVSNTVISKHRINYPGDLTDSINAASYAKIQVKYIVGIGRLTSGKFQ